MNTFALSASPAQAAARGHRRFGSGVQTRQPAPHQGSFGQGAGGLLSFRPGMAQPIPPQPVGTRLGDGPPAGDMAAWSNPQDAQAALGVAAPVQYGPGAWGSPGGEPAHSTMGELALWPTQSQAAAALGGLPVRRYGDMGWGVAWPPPPPVQGVRP